MKTQSYTATKYTWSSSSKAALKTINRHEKEPLEQKKQTMRHFAKLSQFVARCSTFVLDHTQRNSVKYLTQTKESKRMIDRDTENQLLTLERQIKRQDGTIDQLQKQARENLEKIAQLEEQIREGKQRAQQYHADLISSVFLTRNLRQFFRGRLRAISNILTNKITETHERVSNIDTLGPLSENFFKNKNDELLNVVTNATKVPMFILKEDRHIGGHVESITELYKECVRCCDKVNIEEGTNINVEFVNKDNVDPELFIMSDCVFTTNLFAHMGAFMRSCMSDSHKPPEVKYVVKQGEKDYMRWVGLEFVFYDKTLIHDGFQEEYDRFFFDQEEIPERWENLNEDLLDLVVLGAQCSGDIIVEKSAFGVVTFTFGRHLFISANQSDFDDYLQIREKYPISPPAQFVGFDEEKDRESGIVNILEACSSSFGYVPMTDWSPSLCSQVDHLFVSDEICENTVHNLLCILDQTPWRRTMIVAMNRTTPPVEEHDRLVWLGHTPSFDEVGQILKLTRLSNR